MCDMCAMILCRCDDNAYMLQYVMTAGELVEKEEPAQVEEEGDAMLI